MDPTDERTLARWREFVADGTPMPPASITHRNVPPPWHLSGKASAVIGMRRAGKTTFLHQVRRERLAAGVPIERLPYWNFEDQRLTGLRAEDLPLLLEEYYRRYPELRRTHVVTLCLDEIQVVAGWERFVRRLLDTESVEVFVSGSSAAMLSREVATSMRGRGFELVVHPFSFAEVQAHLGRAVPGGTLPLAGRRLSTLEHDLRAYLTAMPLTWHTRLAIGRDARSTADEACACA